MAKTGVEIRSLLRTIYLLDIGRKDKHFWPCTDKLRTTKIPFVSSVLMLFLLSFFGNSCMTCTLSLAISLGEFLMNVFYDSCKSSKVPNLVVPISLNVVYLNKHWLTYLVSAARTVSVGDVTTEIMSAVCFTTVPVRTCLL